MDLSIVIPLYNEQESLTELVSNINTHVKNLNMQYEIIFVDDGSNDGSLQLLKSLRTSFPQIKILSFRKNYGKSAALAEGFKIAAGKIVVTMDADLQDEPAEIPRLINQINTGYDMVSGWKKRRHDPWRKTIPSKFFNFTTSLLSGIKIHDFNCGLKAYRQEVIKELPVYGELHRYLPVLAHRKGYSVGEIVVQHHPRKYGSTKYGLRRFFEGFFDLLTVLFLTRYRQKPLHFFGLFGLICLFFGLLLSAYLTILWFQGHPIGNRPLFFLGILLIIVGIGLIGEMITNVKDEERIYSIKEKML
jgi:glycosyltransferase involved in cell wall biosynthesis